MVKVRLPMMVQDPAILKEEVELLDSVDLEDEFFLDGPVSKRVALLDLDAESGELRSGVKFVPPSRGRVLGKYEIADHADANARDLQAVSIFTTVHKTMQLFEGPDALGRPLTWGFDAPQLLVVPQAGDDRNAYYERESHSLQFFFFPSDDESRTIFSCASRDIVAHETGHAILDGICPDLYNASTPQAIAMHEAIADLTALLSSFACGKLTKAVLTKTKGSIDQPTAFSRIAEDWGGTHPLRRLTDDKSLDPKSGKERFVGTDEPHDLSEVLSGALFRTMVAIYTSLRKKIKPDNPFIALGGAAAQFRRMIFRALDYLPPGEVSFADYGRAILAADQALYPKEGTGRKALIREFVKRKIVPNRAALDVKTNFRNKVVKEADVETLCASDWAAYEFANANRRLFGIPKGIHFRVLPRRESRKLLRRGSDVEIHECIFKVSWDQKERQQLPNGLPSQRQITVGTTLVIDYDTKKVRALLKGEFQEQKASRDRMLKRLAAANAMHVETSGNLMRVRGTARMLHVTRSAGPKEVPAGEPVPPPGVDAGAFYNLVKSRRG